MMVPYLQFRRRIVRQEFQLIADVAPEYLAFCLDRHLCELLHIPFPIYIRKDGVLLLPPTGHLTVAHNKY
jgi:hypothetical protein